MIDREKSTWKCVVAEAELGAPHEVEFSSYWCPEKVELQDIAQAAAAEAWLESGKKQMFLGVSAELIA